MQPLLLKASLVFVDLGLLNEASVLCDEALQISNQLCDPEQILLCVSSLAEVLIQQGKYEDADSFLQDSLKKYETVLGGENWVVLVCYGTLGSCLCRQGKLTESEHFLRRALKGHDILYSSHQESNLVIVDLLGTVLMKQGKLAEAESFLSTCSRRK